ncbi:hypothetical protein NC651_028942 [Populus alba x Populus x berolinensis]|nr:hypothetical protein NC651_028942 [Populus alba x Populus x berolinensis]
MHIDMSPIQKSWERNNKTKILTPKTYCSNLKDKLSTQNQQHEDQHSLEAAQWYVALEWRFGLSMTLDFDDDDEELSSRVMICWHWLPRMEFLS